MDNRIPSELRTYLPWEKKGRSFLCLARILCMVNDNKSLAEEPTVQRIETFLQAKEVAAKHRKTVLEIMDTLCHLLQSPSLRKPFCYSDDMITRVELVMACLLIHLHRKTLSLAKLSEAVRVMRTTVRPDKPGKEDKKYHKALAVFIEKTVPTLTLKAIMDNDQPAVKVVQGPVVAGLFTPGPMTPPLPPSAGSTSTLPSKRKRVTDKVDEECEQRGRLVKRPMVTVEYDSDLIRASRPPIKTPVSKGSVGKKIRDVCVAPSAKPSAATTTVRRTTVAKGQSASSSGAATASNPRAIKPVVSAQPSFDQQVGTPSVRLPSRGRPNASANSPSAADQPLSLSQRPAAAVHPSGPMPTPPLSSGGSASPACHLRQAKIAPVPAPCPASSTPASATSAAQHRPPVTHNLTVAVKSERSSPAVTSTVPRTNRLASVHRAKEQVALQSSERTTDPRTRPAPAPLTSAFAPSASSSSSHTDREAQLQMDVDMLDASLGLSQPGTSNSYSRGGPVTGENVVMAGTGEVLNTVASIGRLDRQHSAIVPPVRGNQPSSALNVDTNIDRYRGLQSAGTTTASQSQSSSHQTPPSSTPISGATGPAPQQQPARSQYTSSGTTPTLTAPLPRANPRIVGGLLTPASASSLTHQQSDELRREHSSRNSRENHHSWRTDGRHREPGAESSSMAPR